MYVGNIAILKLRCSKFKCRFLHLNVCVLGGLLQEKNEQIAESYQTIMSLLTVSILKKLQKFGKWEKGAQ